MTLDISNKLSLSSIQSHYLSRIGSQFREQHEFIDGDLVQYAYCVLRPAISDQTGYLGLFATYLRNSSAVCRIYISLMFFIQLIIIIIVIVVVIVIVTLYTNCNMSVSVVHILENVTYINCNPRFE